MESNEKRKSARILVVDDSAIMRSAIKRVLEQDPRICVVATARNGQEAVEKVRELEPDMLTMDIEMPIMDGLTALRHIMLDYPTPVIMVSSLTSEGAEATFQALELGAVDYIAKSGDRVLSLNTQMGGFLLRQKVRAICAKKRDGSLMQKMQLDSRKLGSSQPARYMPIPTKAVDCRIRDKTIIAIGVSTGGPMALQKVISKLPVDLSVPILIVQHMPSTFIETFAQRLNSLAQVYVKESEPNEELQTGVVYIGHGGTHLKIHKQKSSRINIIHESDTEDSAFVPSADALMSSVALECGKDVLGIIMTGMGSDGLQGMKLIKENGGSTIAQDEQSCVVYGMPKACVDANIIDKIVPLEAISTEIVNATNG